MTIKTNIKTIVNNQTQASLQILGMTDIPANLSYRVAKLLRRVDSAFRDFTNARDKLMQNRHVTVKKDGQGFDYPNKETQEQFDKEFEDLLDEEVEWSNVNPIYASEIMEVRDVSIKPYVWFPLMDWFIIDDEA